MWVEPKAVLQRSGVRWTALGVGSSVAPFQGMGDGALRYALRIRNPGVAWAQQAEARGCREAGGF
jgi:hypothetical protein